MDLKTRNWTDAVVGQADSIWLLEVVTSELSDHVHQLLPENSVQPIRQMLQSCSFEGQQARSAGLAQEDFELCEVCEGAYHDTVRMQ